MKPLSVLLLALAVLTGCSALPETGPVVQESRSGDPGDKNPPLFTPPGPGRGDSPEEIVNGFLVAMQANPSSASTARLFLARSARANWKPDQATMLYQAKGVDEVAGMVQVRLVDAVRLDSRGGWLGRVSDGSDRFTLVLKRERGQWRISDPPNVLLLPVADFEARYVPYNIYFYDSTGELLVPDRVYLPRGSEAPSALVRSLLAGPSARTATVLHSEFDPSTTLGLSVVVGADGGVQVPLSPDVRQLPPARLTKAVAQLTWTLRQIPGLRRMRLTVEDETLPLPSGVREVSLSQPGPFTPTIPGSNELFGLRQGRVVTLNDTKVQAVAGPFGKGGFALRSIGVSLDGKTIAAVAGNGRDVFVAPTSNGDTGAVQKVFAGTSVLKPRIDRFGLIWLVDRTARGARVFVVGDGGARSVRAAGITGNNVADFAISRDGTSLVAAINRGRSVRTPRLAVSQVLRTGAAYPVLAPARAYEAGISELTALSGVTFTSGNDLAVLGSTTPGRSQLVLTTIEGSPGSNGQTLPDALRGQPLSVTSLPGVAGQATQVRLLTPGRSVLELAPSGRWLEILRESKFTALTFAG